MAVGRMRSRFATLLGRESGKLPHGTGDGNAARPGRGGRPGEGCGATCTVFSSLFSRCRYCFSMRKCKMHLLPQLRAKDTAVTSGAFIQGRSMLPRLVTTCGRLSAARGRSDRSCTAANRSGSRLSAAGTYPSRLGRLQSVAAVTAGSLSASNRVAGVCGALPG